MSTAYALFHGVHLLAAALIIGFMAIVQWSVVPSQNELDGPAYARFERRMNVPLQRLTPALLLTAIVAGATTAVLAFAIGSGWAWAHLAVTGALVGMTVSTLIVNAPVNREIDGWDPERLPANWAQRRSRWEQGHAIRVAMGLPALALAVVTAVIG